MALFPFDAFTTDVMLFFVDDALLGLLRCGVVGVAVVNVDWMVVNEGVEGGGGAVPIVFPMELPIILSLGVDGNVSSNWKARSNARSKK